MDMIELHKIKLAQRFKVHPDYLSFANEVWNFKRLYLGNYELAISLPPDFIHSYIAKLTYENQRALVACHYQVPVEKIELYTFNTWQYKETNGDTLFLEHIVNIVNSPRDLIAGLVLAAHAAPIPVQVPDDFSLKGIKWI